MDKVLARAMTRKPEPIEWDETTTTATAVLEEAPVEEEASTSPALNEGGHTPEPERVPPARARVGAAASSTSTASTATIIGVDGRPGLDSAVICRATLEEPA